MKTLFLGDFSPTADNAHLFLANDQAALFSDLPSLFAGNDVSMVNLECALTESEGAICKIGPALKAPTAAAAVMRELGITHCGLSNNHFFDYGKQGALDSLRALDAAGIGHTGFGENEADSRRDLVIEKDGETLALEHPERCHLWIRVKTEAQHFEGEGYRVSSIRIAAGARGDFLVGSFLAEGARILSVEEVQK